MHGLFVSNRSDEQHPVHLPREARQQLANLNPFRRGRDRLPRPPDFGRGFGFEIEQVDLTRPAVHIEQNAGLRAGSRSLRGILCRAKHTGQRQAAKTNAADLQQ